MIKSAILLILLSSPLFGGALEWSVGFVIGGTMVDSASSWGRRELNPVLGGGRFGGSHLGRKIAITGLSVGLPLTLLRKEPRLRKPLTVVNLVGGSVMVGLAARNWRQR